MESQFSEGFLQIHQTIVIKPDQADQGVLLFCQIQLEA